MTIDIPPQSPDRLERFLVDLDQSSTDEPLELDLRNVLRLDRAAGAVVSTALLGSLGHRSLNVRLHEHGRTGWLDRAGLAFAFANRRGPTLIDGSAATDQLANWRQTWTPGSRRAWDSLFGIEQGSDRLFGPEVADESPWVPDLFGPYFAAFVNPHRVGLPHAQDHPLRRIVWPWLDRLLPRAHDGFSNAARVNLLDDLGSLVDELLSNISEHGAGKGPDVHSLVHAAVTRGDDNRLHLSFADTGPGILATLRPKLRREDAERTDEDVLAGALRGDLRSWGAGRGMGLPKVLSVCALHGARLRINTGLWRLQTDDGNGLAVTRGRFDLRGTVAVITVRLPRPV